MTQNNTLQIDDAQRQSSSKISVAVDTLAIQPSSGGIRVYLRELLYAAASDINTEFTLICSASNQTAFNDLNVTKIIRIPWSTTSRATRIITQQVIVPLILLRMRPDVLFTPVDVAPVLAPAPIVTSLHSSHLNALHGYTSYIQSQYNRIFLGATVRRATKIIAISRHVRDQTAQIFKTDPRKLLLVHHGGGIVERARKAGWRPPEDKHRDGGILFVGSLQRYKRANSLILAYACLYRRYQKKSIPPLIIVGKNVDNMAESLRLLAQQEGVSKYIKIMGHVTDGELLNLYEHSKVLVLPSEIEGFGLPVVEAMQAGLPVVVADRGALPEIAGKAALKIDPDDIESLTEAIASALWDQKCRQRMIDLGFDRASAFDWKNCSKQTLHILRQTAQGSGS